MQYAPPVSTTITIHYTGADLIPVTLDQSTVQSTDVSYTITGTNSPLTTAIAVYNNNILQGQATITGMTWSFEVTISEGVNVIRVEASPNPYNGIATRYCNILKNYRPSTTIRYRNDENDYSQIIFYGTSTNATEIEVNGQTTTPVDGVWEFGVTGIPIGAHNELVVARNDYLFTNYNVRIDIKPIANLRRLCKVYAKGEDGVLRAIHPIMNIDGIMRRIQCMIALESVTVFMTGVQVQSAVGTIVCSTPSNAKTLTGVQAQSSVGSLYIIVNDTEILTGIQSQSAVGSIIAQEPTVKVLEGVQAQSAVDTLILRKQMYDDTPKAVSGLMTTPNTLYYSSRLPANNTGVTSDGPIWAVYIVPMAAGTYRGLWLYEDNNADLRVVETGSYYFAGGSTEGWYTLDRSVNGIKLRVDDRAAPYQQTSSGITHVKTITWTT